MPSNDAVREDYGTGGLIIRTASAAGGMIGIPPRDRRGKTNLSLGGKSCPLTRHFISRAAGRTDKPPDAGRRLDGDGGGKGDNVGGDSDARPAKAEEETASETDAGEAVAESDGKKVNVEDEAGTEEPAAPNADASAA